LYSKIGVKSTKPASASTTVAKTSATQSSISFTLTTYPTGTYKIYTVDTGGAALTDIIATLSPAPP
jgi:hypothetical protein